jgi:hypothetical protein
MSNLINLYSKRFGRLVVIKRHSSDKHGSVRWLCKCDCGSMVIIRGDSLRRGVTVSCGCYARENPTFGNLQYTIDIVRGSFEQP